MARHTVVVCDLCGASQRKGAGVHWTLVIDGPVKLDFKAVPGNQTVLEFDAMCGICARHLTDGIAAIIKGLKNGGSS